VKSKSTLSRSVEDFLIFLCRPLGSIHVLENATGEGVSGVKAPRSDRRAPVGLSSVCTSRCESLPYVLSPLAFESSFVGFKDLLAYFEAPLLGVGIGIGDSSVVLPGACRDLTEPHRSLLSYIRP
jgi:hypothetical protein